MTVKQGLDGKAKRRGGHLLSDKGAGGDDRNRHFKTVDGLLVQRNASRSSPVLMWSHRLGEEKGQCLLAALFFAHLDAGRAFFVREYMRFEFERNKVIGRRAAALGDQ